MSDATLSGQAPSPRRGPRYIAGAIGRCSINATGKRILDVVGAVSILAAVAPLMLWIGWQVRRDGGPVLFSHFRVGRGGRLFPCFKFRSMVTDADACLARLLATDPTAAAEWAARRKLADDPRVTRIGAFLRRTSLDELPQLLNVLRGEMSLVGPRPVVPEELHLHYGEAAAEAYRRTRPGITGLWQVSGRSDTTYAERVRLDARYVRDWSLALDLRILLRTVPAVLHRRGAV